MPEAQLPQDEAPALEKRPAAQLEHAASPVEAAYLPAEHALQAEPEVLTVPAPHELQLEEPADEALPAAQA